MRYYRVSSIEYSPGDSIWETGERHPGKMYNLNFFLGLIRNNDLISILKILFLKKDDPNISSFRDAFKEAYLEFHRESNFPDLPKRHTSMHVFLDKKTAEKFNNDYRKGKNYIYEVEVAGMVGFTADMLIIDTWKALNFDELKAMSDNYWKSIKTVKPTLEHILYPGTKCIVVNRQR